MAGYRPELLELSLHHRRELKLISLRYIHGTTDHLAEYLEHLIKLGGNSCCVVANTSERAEPGHNRDHGRRNLLSDGSELLRSKASGIGGHVV